MYKQFNLKNQNTVITFFLNNILVKCVIILFKFFILTSLSFQNKTYVKNISLPKGFYLSI